MQPLFLRLYEKSTNSIREINGYELIGNNQVKVYDPHYSQTFKFSDIKILRCSGIHDHNNHYLFEGDIVELMLRDRTFKGTVTFQEGQFVCEGSSEVIHEWPNYMQIGRCGNIFTNPLALQSATV